MADEKSHRILVFNPTDKPQTFTGTIAGRVELDAGGRPQRFVGVGPIDAGPLVAVVDDEDLELELEPLVNDGCTACEIRADTGRTDIYNAACYVCIAAAAARGL